MYKMLLEIFSMIKFLFFKSFRIIVLIFLPLSYLKWTLDLSIRLQYYCFSDTGLPLTHFLFDFFSPTIQCRYPGSHNHNLKTYTSIYTHKKIVLNFLINNDVKDFLFVFIFKNNEKYYKIMFS